ncbi:unnamed protein product [Lactuca virosa]|uniref:Reticulon-like protein n=1 Tax=Lactuca virosa TaxID=75947 RepID=A0AAU9N4P0_9ASTR|nr:unnamed protein product [Lactuca virosa]
MARVFHYFNVVADEFLEYVIVAAGMSTLWRLRGKMPEFYVMSRFFFYFSLLLLFPSSSPLFLRFCLYCIAVEKRVDFMDVVAKKWVGSLRYLEMELIDRFAVIFFS